MPASFYPFGFVPIEHRTGGKPELDFLPGGIASGYGSNIFIGDPVKFVTAGVLNVAAAGDAMSGVFAGVEFVDAAGKQTRLPYWPASQVATRINVLWYRDPDIIYRVQASATLAQTSIGDATDHQLGSGDVKSGKSRASLNVSLVGAGNSAQWKIKDIDKVAGNAWGDTYPIALVIMNELNLGLVPGNAI